MGEDDWDALDWHEHDAPLEPLVWGRSTYTIIRVAPSLVAAAESRRTRRVAGWIEDEEVNVGLNRADVILESFLYCGPALQRRLGVRAGDVVRLRLRPVDPDLVPVPDDVATALADAGVLDAFERRRPAERRQLLVPVADAARPATRASRIEALVRALR